MKSKVTIRRKDLWFNRFRDYKIFINQEFYGVISNNSSLELVLDKKSNIQLKIDWCTSPVIEVDPKEGNIILSCSCIIKKWKYLYYPLYLSIFRNKYILLEKV